MQNVTMLLLYVLILLNSGCSLPRIPVKVEDEVKVTHVLDEGLFSHMLPLAGNGLRDCTVKAQKENELINETNCNSQKEAESATDQNIKRITDGLTKAINKYKKVQVLLYAHGGLNSRSSASGNARKILANIQQDNEMNQNIDPNRLYIYPIFINWRSGMIEAYRDHLLFIRQGDEVSDLTGLLSLPVYLAADIGRAASRLPITYFYQAHEMAKSFFDSSSEESDEIQTQNYTFYGDKYHAGHAISLGSNKNNDLFDKAMEMEKKVLIPGTIPGAVRLVSTPLLDTIGKSAWDNMLRKTKLLFRTPLDYKVENTKDFAYRYPNGGFSKLMRALRSSFKKNQDDGNLSVTLMGHSMGTIVMSQLLREFNDEKDDLVYNDIVFMAAACTVRDFEQAVIPYLKNHQTTNFYNLTLHPYAEVNESFLNLDLVPRGSLLVWIDDFASAPETLADKTLGKWVNAQKEWPFIPTDVRGQITLKGFGISDDAVNIKVGDKYKPEEHGHFGDADTYFWRRDFWQAKVSQ